MNVTSEKEIQKWIKEAKKRGASKSEIESELKRHGYNSSLINKTLNNKTRNYVIIALLILMLLSSAVIYFMFFKTTTETNTYSEELKQAETLLENRNYAEAERIYQKILIGNPDLEARYIANRDLGRAYYEQRRHNKSIAYYERAIELKPDRAYAANRDLGVIYYRLGDYDTSLKYLNTAVVIINGSFAEPRADRLYFFLASAYAQKKEFDKSVEYHRKVIQVPENIANPYFLGYSYYLLGMYDKAEFYLNKGLEDTPQTVQRSEIENILNTIKESKKP